MSDSSELEYAKQLAIWTWEDHYKSESPRFTVQDDLMGVLSQIDNMLTGLVRRPAADDS